MKKEKDLINYQQKYQPFYINLNKYLKIYIIPEVIAFYLASSFEYKSLGKHNLKNHLNSALSLFNVNIDTNSIIPIVKQILKIKYNLKIIKENPLILEKER